MTWLGAEETESEKKNFLGHYSPMTFKWRTWGTSQKLIISSKFNFLKFFLFLLCCSVYLLRYALVWNCVFALEVIIFKQYFYYMKNLITSQSVFILPLSNNYHVHLVHGISFVLHLGKTCLYNWQSGPTTECWMFLISSHVFSEIKPGLESDDVSSHSSSINKSLSLGHSFLLYN